MTSIMEIDIYGTKRWRNIHGEIHRDDKDPETGLTLPSVEWEGGSKRWHRDGKIHRDDKDPETGLTLPSVESATGSKAWRRDGKYHRDDKDPETGMVLHAEEHANGTKVWRREGKRHRDYDYAAVEYPGGQVEYWKDDVRYTPQSGTK